MTTMTANRRPSRIRAYLTCAAAPVQIEGTVNGMHFYFRARWDSWGIGFGSTLDEAVQNELATPFASGHYPGASYMPHDEAWRLVMSAIEDWLRKRTEKAV